MLHWIARRLATQIEIIWDPTKTAFVICDMWEKHWCLLADYRAHQLAPSINAVANELRRQGALVIHAPSGGSHLYEGWEQRQRVQKTPHVRGHVEIMDRRFIHHHCESGLPIIVGHEGGCDCTPVCVLDEAKRDRHQTSSIDIHPEDAIAESTKGHEGEVYSLMHEHGIEAMIIAGVHLNICVLGRPFGIRQMRMLGKDVLLVRDLTDSMYDPRQPPHVNHHEGTKLVVNHVERWWCPTITSNQIIGGEPFKFTD